MSSQKQHVVPRFYLRHFSPDGKQLNVYNLQRNKTILGASLKGQCYRRGVYGDTPDVEKALAKHETILAPIVAAIVNTTALPSRLVDYFYLLQFVSSLHLRPGAAIDEMNTSLDMLVKDLMSRTSPYTKEDLDLVRVRANNAGPMLASQIHRAGRALLDLKPALVMAPDKTEWITSDHPLIAYNTYTEELPETQPGHGFMTIGLQLFLPLSPRVLLLLFDGTIYRQRDANTLQTATPADTNALNLLQAAYAQENLYFLSDGLTPFLELRRRATDARAKRSAFVSQFTRADQALEEDGTRSEVMRWGTVMPNLHLRLSFLSPRKTAARVPLTDRFGYRPQPPDPDEPPEDPRVSELAGRRYALRTTTHRKLLDS